MLLSATGASKLFFILWWGRREGQDNRISDDDWLRLSKSSWANQKQCSVYTQTPHTHTAASHTRPIKGKRQQWRVRRESWRFQSGSTDATLISLRKKHKNVREVYIMSQSEVFVHVSCKQLYSNEVSLNGTNVLLKTNVQKHRCW